MLGKYEDVLKCEICGESLYFDGDSTVDEYAIYMSINYKNIHQKVEDLINDYLVYTCSSCKKRHKYTTKKVEHELRKALTQRALILLIKDIVPKDLYIIDRYLIYCGKCSGLDGKGSCPKSIFDPCQIKRFPINECL
jgi:hypothetical protein